MYIYPLIYVLLSLVLFTDFCKVNQRNTILSGIAICMILFIGLRGESGVDSINYIDFFKNHTDTFWNWKNEEKGYAEHGFYFLSIILKSIWNNINFYFLSISAITIFFLIKSLKEFSLYPLLGFCTYYSRFLIIRDMNQIRQALAMVIIIYGFKYLLQDKKRIYLLCIIGAILMHYSSITVIPFLFLYKYKLSLKQATTIIVVSLIIGIIGGILLKVVLIKTGFVIFLRYINTENLGLINPVLIFQLMLCIIFFYYESILKKAQKGYYIIRNAYLYSTILLVLTCNMGEIGGRLATIFATCEIFIIPALSVIIKPRVCGYLICWILTAFLFFMNYQKLLQEPEYWNYFSLNI